MTHRYRLGLTDDGERHVRRVIMILAAVVLIISFGLWWSAEHEQAEQTKTEAADTDGRSNDA